MISSNGKCVPIIDVFQVTFLNPIDHIHVVTWSQIKEKSSLTYLENIKRN